MDTTSKANVSEQPVGTGAGPLLGSKRINKQEEKEEVKNSGLQKRLITQANAATSNDAYSMMMAQAQKKTSDKLPPPFTPASGRWANM